MKIYLAANYAANAQMREVAALLVSYGHEPICEWIEGTHQGDAQERWAVADIRDLDAAEAIVLFTKDFVGSRVRGGKHVEFGYALAKGKRLILVGERKNVFHYLSQVEVVEDVPSLLDLLRQPVYA